MKKGLVAFLMVVGLLVSGMTLVLVGTASAELGGQVFFRGGAGISTGGGRGNEVFTDTNGATIKNGDDTGFSVGAGFDIPLFKDPWFQNTVLGEILIDYAQFSKKKVTQTTSALLGNPTASNVTVNEVAMVAAPKYRIELGKVRPWIIPIGLEWQVISPPSNDTTYLDLGMHFAAGIEYRIADPISIGVDLRYHYSVGATNARSIDFITTGGYLGFNF